MIIALICGGVLLLYVLLLALLETAAPPTSKDRYYDDLDQIKFIKKWNQRHY